MTNGIPLALLLPLASCASYEQFRHMAEEFEIPSRIYDVEYVRGWQSVLDVMQHYDLEVTNQESGVLRTRWIDNTNETNFTNSFGAEDSVKSARMKIVVNAVKGFRGAREVTKVSVFKRQMVEHDFLQGWRIVPSDGILERTILYRVGRVVANQRELERLEERRGEEVRGSF